MATCEELQAQITVLEAALIVDDASIQAAQNIKAAHQMELWYAQYNSMLQGCGPGGMEVVAAREMPPRTEAEMSLIKSIPDLWLKHQMCLELFVEKE